MASQLFAQPFVEAQIKENIKVPRHWPLWAEFTGVRWMWRCAGNAGNVFPITAVERARHALRHVRAVMHAWITICFLWSRWRGKRPRRSRRKNNPRFYVSDKRPMWYRCLNAKRPNPNCTGVTFLCLDRSVYFTWPEWLPTVVTSVRGGSVACRIQGARTDVHLPSVFRLRNSGSGNRYIEDGRHFRDRNFKIN